jgi:hypothetical protein
MFDYFDVFSDDRDDILECLHCLLFCKIQYHVWPQWNVQLLVIVGVGDIFGNSCGDMATDLFSSVQQEQGTLYGQRNVLVERGFILHIYCILCSPEDKWVVMR